MTTTHFLFDKRVQIFQRADSRIWQCAARLEGSRFRASTGEEDLDRAKDVAEEWYLDLRGKRRSGELRILVDKPKERTFRDAYDEYVREVSVLAISTRSPKYIELMRLRMNRHVLPFMGDKGLSEINKGLVQSYRVKRAEETIAKTGKPPARSTMLQEIVHIRQVLKFAEGKGWISFVPSLETPYLSQTKKGRRAWFSPDEYKRLYEATRRRISEGKRPGWKSHYEDMHDYVLFMANTGLRPDEAAGLQIRDVVVVDDYATRETILEIDVRGKIGVGYAKSTSHAVHPFKRLRDRRRGELASQFPIESAEQIERRLTTTSLFRPFDRDMFNKILQEEGLRTDRDGKRRTAYSLRHTYISNRLMEGASIHMVANNCRTSVQMIEEHYASHIKDRIDAAALNVMRPKRQRAGVKRNDAERAKRDNGAPEILD